MTTLWAYLITYQTGVQYHRVYRSFDSGASWSQAIYLGNGSTFFPNYGDRRMHGIGDNIYLATQGFGLWHKPSGATYPYFTRELYSGIGGVPANTYFYSVFAIADDDVWVGATHGLGSSAAVYHWDGASWNDLSAGLLAVRSNATQVMSVWASSDTDVWFCGEDISAGNFVVHYNGSTWSDRTPVGTPPGNEILHSLFGFASNDVWVCGDLESGPVANVLQWTGASWTARNDATLNSYGESWNHLGGLSSSDLWMATSWEPDLAHWNGSAWTIVTPSGGGPTFGQGINLMGPVNTDLWFFGENTAGSINVLKSAQPPLTLWTDRKFDPSYTNTVIGIYAEPESPIIILDWRQEVSAPPGVPIGGNGERNALTFDPVTAKTYLHYDHTTWSFDGSSWTIEQTGGGPLSAGGSGGSCAIAYFPTHPLGPRHVFYGGSVVGGGAAINETWLLDTSTTPITWTRIFPAHSPYVPTFVKASGSMAYDGIRVLLTHFDGTFLYDGTDWSAAPITPPNGTNYFDIGMARDLGTGNVIMFDRLTSPKTWRWNATTTTWVDVTPSISPPRRRDFPLAYSSSLGGVVLFGGWDHTYKPMADIWYWDDTLEQWNRVWHRYELDLNVTGMQHSMVWDSVRNRIVIIGMNTLF